MEERSVSTQFTGVFAMMLLTVVVTAFVIWGVGRFLFRLLGWPLNPTAAGRWCVALLVTALLFAGTRDGLGQLAARMGPLPLIPLQEVVPVLALLGLAILGYVSWTRGEAVREAQRDADERARGQQRQRAAPPPPSASVGDPFVPLDPPHGEA
jgi:hypothetical protein